jgi:hypothetical protein
MQEMRRLRKELKGLIAECDANPDETACPVIDRLAVRQRQVR